MTDEQQPVAGPPGRVPRRALSDDHFRRAMAFTVAGTLIPGSRTDRGQASGGRCHRVGVFLGAVVVLAGWAITDPQAVAAMAFRPSMLNGLAVALVITAVAWVGVVVATHLALRSSPNRTQRIAGGVLVGVLAFAVAAPMAVAARYSYDQASLVSTVFKSEKDTKSRPPGRAAGRPSRPSAGRDRSRPSIRGRTSRGSTCCCSAATPARAGPAPGPTR